MYPHKFTTSSMSFYNFSSLTFFHEISYSTSHKFVLNQHNCRMNPCKNKNSSNVNIQKCTKSKTNIQAQIKTLNSPIN